ncbi:MAG: AAA family ATPase [Phycisphaerae bacterium]|nr:AAA family ATPase [Phycisphaerae bacterium]
MAKVLAIANQKGGCGKTTVAINLSACLSMQGKRTLLVDMDPQGHCGLGLAVPEEQVEQSIYDVLSRSDDTPVNMEKVIWQIGKNFDLAPASLELAAFEQQFAGMPGREMRLKNVLDSVADKYDYCVIDCPPAVSLLTFNALRAANAVIIPVETGYFSVHGLKKQLETLEMLKKQCGQELTIKVVANLYDVRTKLGREMLGEMRKQFGHLMFQTYVNFNIKIKEGSSLGQAISEYDSSSMGFKDFSKLAQEVIKAFEPAVSIENVVNVETQAVADDLMSKAESLSRRAEELLQESASTLGKEPKIIQQAPVEEKLELVYGVTRTEDGIKFLADYPHASQVCVAGDFNNWSADATPMNRLDQVEKNGAWEVTIPVETGRYRYRYVVDGAWQHDPHNNYVESNPYGELNSVIEV